MKNRNKYDEKIYELMRIAARLRKSQKEINMQHPSIARAIRKTLRDVGAY